MGTSRAEQLQEEIAEALRSLTYAINEHFQSKNSVELEGSNPVAFNLVLGQTDGQRRPTRVKNVLLGWSLRETTGNNPATLILRDGHDTGGDEIASVTLNASESTRDLFPFGISLVDGLYLDVQLGAVAGVIYLGNA